jgi:hypothetical protein
VDDDCHDVPPMGGQKVLKSSNERL